MIPDVPTARQAGTSGSRWMGWSACSARRRFRRKLRDQIAADVIAAASDQELSSRISATGQIVRPGGADEFAKEIELQSKVVSDAAAAAGMKRMLQN